MPLSDQGNNDAAEDEFWRRTLEREPKPEPKPKTQTTAWAGVGPAAPEHAPVTVFRM